jgi:predicted transposase/invertase (TIGR01784 family)
MKCNHDEGFRAGEERGLRRGIKKGRETGREEGITFRNFQIAMEMKKAGMSIDLITQLTGLSPKQIRQTTGQ